MSEPTERELLQELVHDVKHIKDKQDHMKEKQDSMDLRLNEVVIELKGTSMDPERGLVNRVKQNEKCIATIKKKQYKIFTWAVVLVAVLNGLLIGLKTLIEHFKT